MVDGDPKKITAQTVYEASKKGDVIAREVVRETARFLGAGVSNLLNLFNPDVVVLAGGVTQAGEALFRPLRAEVKRRAFKPAVDACRIVPGALPSPPVSSALSPRSSCSLSVSSRLMIRERV